MSATSLKQVKPNIIVILADDMGWNDISAHGSNQIPTPNIDAIGFNGIIFKRHYTMHLCTPSRSALLTGIHPIKAGMQGYPINAGEARALPTYMSTLAERLLALGYNTHMVGKWHLGHENRSVTPTGRGFQSHLGYWNGFVGYFDYEIAAPNNMKGLDLHHDYHSAHDLVGKYATDVFTDASVELIKSHTKKNPLFLMINHLAAHTGKDGTELGVPNVQDAMEKYNYIEEPQRRLYAEVVNRMDESVGKIMKALEDKDMLKDSIVVFMSDNGAPTTGEYKNFGSNWPLRGLKSTLYEGGIRNAAVMWSNRLHNKRRVENTLFHITDWMPTLYAAAVVAKIKAKETEARNKQKVTKKESKIEKLKIDKLKDEQIREKYQNKIKELRDSSKSNGTNENGELDGYFGDNGRSGQEPEYNISAVLTSDSNQAILQSKGILTPKLTARRIFQLRSEMDIKHSDPTETTDISTKLPGVVAQLTVSINTFRKELVPQRNVLPDPASDPKNCNGTWFTWLDLYKTETEICAVRTNCLWYDKKLKEVQHHTKDHTEFQIRNGVLYRRFWDPSDITELNDNSEWKRPPRISTPSQPPLPVDFKIPTTPPRRLDAAQIAQELSVMPVMLSPLPVTPDQFGKPPPFSPSDWLNLDTSPLLVTLERANTPSPQRDLYAPRLLELAPAPVLSAPTKKNRMYQLFCSASPPLELKRPRQHQRLYPSQCSCRYPWKPHAPQLASHQNIQTINPRWNRRTPPMDNRSPPRTRIVPQTE
ncbi:uncharacterized protein CBL_02929 [Carabus blaptoides fortunei]